MDRPVDYLLKKYVTRDINEEWSDASNSKFISNIRTQDKMEILETIINERRSMSKGTFRFTLNQKQRAEYLIKQMDFSLGPTNTEQFIVMIMVYVKLETNTNLKLRDYSTFLFDYDISATKFINFLIKLNKYHISKIPIA